MDLTKGRKSKNILDRRNSNTNAFVSSSGNRYADEKDFSESYTKAPKERVKLGDLYDKTVKALDSTKKKAKPKVLDKYKNI